MKHALCCVSLFAGFSDLALGQPIQFASEQAAADLRIERQPWHPETLVAVLGEERGHRWDAGGRGIAVHPDGRQVAVGGFGGVIYLLDAQTLRLERILRGDASFTSSVLYSPAGDALLSVGSDMLVQSWKLDGDAAEKPASLAALGHFPSSAAWSADGGTLVIRDQGVHVWRRTGGAGMVKLASVEEKKPDHGIPLEIQQVASALGARGTTFWANRLVAVSSDGTWIAATSGGGIIGIQLDGNDSVAATAASAVTLWRVAGGSIEKRWTIEGLPYVGGLSFSPDGRNLAVGTHDHKVHLFDVEGELPQSRLVIPNTAPITALCFDPRGEMLAIAAESVQLWDVSQQPPVQKGEGPLAHAPATDGSQMAFSRDGSTFYYVDGCIVRRWSVAAAAPEAVREGTPSFGGVHSLDITPDGRRLVAATREAQGGGLAVWHLNSLAALPMPRALFPDAVVKDVTISPDAQTFVISVYKHSRYRLELWRLGEREIERLAEADVAAGHPGSFCCAVFSPDGSTLATGHRDGQIRTWDVRDGRLKSFGDPVQADDEGVGGLAFSPDGRALASVDWAGDVILWQREVNGFRRRARLGNHKSRAHTVRFCPNARLLASGDSSGAIHLWNLAAEEPQPLELQAHTSNITSLDFAHDGRSLVSAGGDGRVIIWDVAAGKPRKEWRFPGHVFSAKYHPSGQFVLSANANGTIYIWRP